MFLFGHVGLTLGAAWLLSHLLTPRERRTEELLKNAEGVNRSRVSLRSRLRSFISRLDYRIVLVGSMLPDIIDKPIGQLFFRDYFSNGRIFSHTLLFLILITLAGLYLYRSHGRTWLITLSFGTLTHLIFDQMWRSPQTLLWPLYGFAFDRGDLTDWLPNMLRDLLTDPEAYIPELVGIAILTYFALILARKRRLLYFFKSGQTP